MHDEIKHDFHRKNYHCPYYGRPVTVSIKRTLCNKGEACPEPPPHVLGSNFHSCTGILDCGVAEVIGGDIVTAKIHLCPARQSIDNGGEI